MINLYIVDYFDLTGNGLSTYINQLTNILPKNVIQLNYVWVKSNSKYKELTKEIKGTATHIFVPGEITQPGNQSPSFEVKAVDFIAGEVGGKHNIIFHFNWISHSRFAYILKNRFDCKILLTNHCIPWRDFITKDFNTFFHLNRQLKRKQLATYLHPALIKEKISYEATDHIICVTDFASKAIQKMSRIPVEKISLIYNGLNFSISRANKSLLRKKYGFDNQEKIILFAGKIHQSKGVNDLIIAFDRLFLKNRNNISLSARLVIAGAGNFTELLKCIDNSYSAITITGPLNKKKLYDFYQVADVGVVPSYVEQCSYTAIEMMHFGLPIIVSDVDGLAEIVPDDCGLKVPLVLGKSKAYIHQKKLADSILYFLNNPETAKEYAERARQHALKNFTAKKMVAETIEVYEKLIGEANVTKQELKLTSNVPLVSVLLPVYNGEKHLKDCIDSILKQIYSNFELIIINDGSTDSTAKITERYRDSRIILFNNGHHQGESDCLNQSIKMAKGKYIVPIDADSIMHRERLQKQVAFLEDEKNKNITLVGCQHYIIDDEGKPVNLKQYPVTDAEIKATMLFRNPFSKAGILARSETLKKYKYAKKYEHTRDYQFWLKLLENNKGANINEFLSYKYLLATSEQQRKEISESTASLLSEQLEKWGIDSTVEELKIHIAINCGYGRRFFNSQDKISALKNWVIKILTSQKAKFGYSNTFIKKMQQHIVEYYCDVY